MMDRSARNPWMRPAIDLRMGCILCNSSNIRPGITAGNPRKISAPGGDAGATSFLFEPSWRDRGSSAWSPHGLEADMVQGTGLTMFQPASFGARTSESRPRPGASPRPRNPLSPPLMAKGCGTRLIFLPSLTVCASSRNA